MKARADQSGYLRYRWKRDGKYVEVYEHRLMMEWEIGRPLRADEVVHHKNHDPSDNRIENLELMSREAHMEHHGLASKALPFLTCAGCGIEFTRDYRKQGRKRWKRQARSFCSYECFKRAHPRKTRVPKPRRHAARGTCLECSAEFVKKSSDQRFCSHKCARTASRGRGPSGLLAVARDLRAWGVIARSATPVIPVARRSLKSPGPAECERCGRVIKLTPDGKMRRHFVDMHKETRCG